MEDINTLGFDASFEKHIGMTKEEAYGVTPIEAITTL